MHMIERLAKDTDEEFDDIAREIVDIRRELSKSQPDKGLLRKSFKDFPANVNFRVTA